MVFIVVTAVWMPQDKDRGRAPAIAAMNVQFPSNTVNVSTN
jgi:hypothetical protein